MRARHQHFALAVLLALPRRHVIGHRIAAGRVDVTLPCFVPTLSASMTPFMLIRLLTTFSAAAAVSSTCPPSALIMPLLETSCRAIAALAWRLISPSP